VKVTDAPAQDGFAEGAIDTLTGRIGITVIVTGAEVAGLFVGHGVIFEVRTHVTTSPFSGV
jgi:hypothetical protein